MVSALFIALATALLLGESRRFRPAGDASTSPPGHGLTGVLADIRRAVRRLVHRRHERAHARARAARWVDAVVAELRAGRPPRSALVAAAEGLTTGNDRVLCPRTIAAAGLGGDVAHALHADSRAERLPILSHVAACWTVAENTGSGLAPALEQVLESARSEEDVRAEIEAQLAAPRATARLLAALPLIGILLGTALGAQPVRWLTSSGLGLLVLALGMGEIVLGLWWTARMVSSLERQITGPVRT